MTHRPRRAFVCCTLILLVCSFGAGCRSTNNSADETGDIIVVNAPAAGVVRRVLVSEGMTVAAGTPIVEIALPQSAQTSVPTPGESAEARAVRDVRASQGQIEAARADVIRHQAEVQRLTPLVAAGQASQADLDGERALYDQAQQRLQQAETAARQANEGLIAARQPNAPTSTMPQPAPTEQTVTARATSGGTVRVISARVGDHVTSGQPLATLRGN